MFKTTMAVREEISVIGRRSKTNSEVRLNQAIVYKYEI
nr:MAG TPA: hypothetical protein [Caudoviricetes sp.]